MKKRIGALALTGIMLLSFTACGGGTLEVSDTPAATPTEKVQEQEQPVGFTVTYNGVKIYIGQDMKAVYGAIGETAQIRESGSCKYDGTDKDYKFANISVTAFVEDGKERIFVISLDNDMISTDEGIKIGDSVSQVKVKYGAPEGDSYVYKKDGMVLKFIIKDDEVASITYAAP